MALLVTATPAAATPDGADLAVTVSFDKTEYLAHERVTATFAVTNNGTVPATGVTMTYETNGPFYPEHWYGFDPANGGAVVQPGERVEWSVTVELQTVVDVLRLTVEVHTPDQDTDPANNTASVESTVTTRTTELTGTVYRDLDGDRNFDPGEGMKGVSVKGTGGMPYAEFEIRTDGAGRFAVKDLPEGNYWLTLGLPAGWQQDDSAYVLAEQGRGDVLVRAVPDSSALSGTVTFDKPAYAVGDTIHERVTLTNTGTTDLLGVTARCVEGAAPNQLSGRGWGDLVHYDAPGVTVRAGETRTFEFTDVVPPGGRLYGFISLTCWFSTAFKYDDGVASVARAEVPGGRGSSGGVLFEDRDDDSYPDEDEVLPDVKLFLTKPDGTPVARVVTDATGRFMFTDVPANIYHLRLTGPWRLRDEKMRFNVFDGQVMKEIPYIVMAGPNHTDPEAPPPLPEVDVTEVPDPQAAPLPRPANLADTGADVVELTVFGVLLLLVGGGLLFVRRRSVP
jgi:LPXTG-motif cell wall-anchored protein